MFRHLRTCMIMFYCVHTVLACCQGKTMSYDIHLLWQGRNTSKKANRSHHSKPTQPTTRGVCVLIGWQNIAGESRNCWQVVCYRLPQDVAGTIVSLSTNIESQINTPDCNGCVSATIMIYHAWEYSGLRKRTKPVALQTHSSLLSLYYCTITAYIVGFIQDDAAKHTTTSLVATQFVYKQKGNECFNY